MNQHDMPLSEVVIGTKVLSLYEEVKEQEGEDKVLSLCGEVKE